jgi:diguanylate cyclase (GGDEF)-like protein
LLSSVRSRLFAAVAGMALLASLAIGTVYVATDGERQDVEHDRRVLSEIRALATTMVGAVHDEESGVDDYLLSRDRAAFARYDGARQEEVRTGERISFLAADVDEVPEIATATKGLLGESARWRREFGDPAITAVDTGSIASIRTLSQQATQDQASFESATDTLLEALAHGDENLTGRAAALDRIRTGAIAASLFLMALGAAGAAFLLQRLVARPLGRLVATAGRVEAGEDVAFDLDRNDEIGTLGQALERMRKALQGDAERSGVLNRFTEVTTFAADDTAVAASNLEALRLLVNPDAGVTHVLNRSKDRAIPEATLGEAVAEVLPLNALSRCPGIVRGSIYVTPDVGAPLAVRCPIYRVEAGTLACVPLAHGENVGAVHLAWNRVDAFPLELRSSVARIAEHAALAIANRRLLAALQGMASTDARTGLANTRAFDQALEHELAARTGDESVAVLMLDLDRFKDFNDRHGHPAGDEALRGFAEVLRGSLRDHDVAARYGGEEFAVMLPGVDVEGAIMVAERIRTRTESTLIALGPGITDRVEVSIGVSAAPMQGRDRLTLLRLADEALYAAKQGGRNRVEYLGPRELPAAGRARRRRAS